MTDKEFEQIQKEIREREARTSFPALDFERDPGDTDFHGQHAEFGAARH